MKDNLYERIPLIRHRVLIAAHFIDVLIQFVFSNGILDKLNR